MTTRTKQPTEILTYAMDFVDLLCSGDDLASVTSITSSPTGLTISAGSISGTEVQFNISGGTDDTTYHIEVIVVTTGAETLEGDGYLFVTDTPCVQTDVVYDYTTLRVAIADFLGWGRNSEGEGASWSDTDEYRMASIMKSAVTQVYYPEGGYQWSWLKPTSTLSLTAPYETGTLEVIAGVATLTSGTFPSWAAQGEITVNGSVHAVSTRDSNTQVTLQDTSVSEAAGSAYSLSRYIYDLPSDFTAFDGQLTYAANQSAIYPPIEHAPDIQIRRQRQYSWGDGYPKLASIRPKSFDPATGQQWLAVFWPTPDDDYTLEYRYRVEPRLLSARYPYPMGGPEVGELILEACLAVAEQRYRDEESLHSSIFARKLVAAIEHDRMASSPDTLGYNADRSDGRPVDRFNGIAVHSYEGTVYYD